MREKTNPPNRRSRDVPQREREALVAKAMAIQADAPALLAAHGIPFNGNGAVFFAPKGPRRPAAISSISISGVTTQEASFDMERACGGRVCVFVACSHSKPGGGWLSGAIAQEESVSRESTWAVQAAEHAHWHKSSSDWMGPPGALVLDGLSFFHGSASPALFAGVCAANKNACDPSEWERLRLARVERLADAIEAGLIEAGLRGCSGAVLCAFGTGVFGWNPSGAMEAATLGLSRSGISFPVVLAAGTPEAAAILQASRPSIARPKIAP